IIFFVVVLFTVNDYGMNEDTPGHFFRGQAYLTKLTTGKEIFDQQQFPSPILFIPGQRISEYKLNVYEAQLSPIRPIASFEGSPTVQKIFSDYNKKFGRHSFYKNNAWGYQYEIENDGGHPPLSDIL